MTSSNSLKVFRRRSISRMGLESALRAMAHTPSRNRPANPPGVALLLKALPLPLLLVMLLPPPLSQVLVRVQLLPAPPLLLPLVLLGLQPLLLGRPLMSRMGVAPPVLVAEAPATLPGVAGAAGPDAAAAGGCSEGCSCHTGACAGGGGGLLGQHAAAQPPCSVSFARPSPHYPRPPPM